MLDITARQMAGAMTWMTGPRTLGGYVIPQWSAPRNDKGNGHRQ
jgi:hypothetical protein